MTWEGACIDFRLQGQSATALYWRGGGLEAEGVPGYGSSGMAVVVAVVTVAVAVAWQGVGALDRCFSCRALLQASLAKFSCNCVALPAEHREIHHSHVGVPCISGMGQTSGTLFLRQERMDVMTCF